MSNRQNVYKQQQKIVYIVIFIRSLTTFVMKIDIIEVSVCVWVCLHLFYPIHVCVYVCAYIYIYRWLTIFVSPIIIKRISFPWYTELFYIACIAYVRHFLHIHMHKRTRARTHTKIREPPQNPPSITTTCPIASYSFFFSIQWHFKSSLIPH